MPKALDKLDASKAGVSQAELETAFVSLGTLEEELADEDAALESALDGKRRARATLDKATDKVREAIATRDPVYEEWQRADWIVRNADPDQPIPASVSGPQIRTRRTS